MGHSTAEAVVRAGITLVPYSFTGQSEAVAVGKMGVSGIPVELVGPEERQAALDHIRRCVEQGLQRGALVEGACRGSVDAGDRRPELALQGSGGARCWCPLSTVHAAARSQPASPPPSLCLCSKYPELIVVDYTLPAVLNENATFYCENKLPFVMGGWREAGWEGGCAEHLAGSLGWQ